MRGEAPGEQHLACLLCLVSLVSRWARRTNGHANQRPEDRTEGHVVPGLVERVRNEDNDKEHDGHNLVAVMP